MAPSLNVLRIRRKHRNNEVEDEREFRGGSETHASSLRTSNSSCRRAQSFLLESSFAKMRKKYHQVKLQQTKQAVKQPPELWQVMRSVFSLHLRRSTSCCRRREGAERGTLYTLSTCDLCLICPLRQAKRLKREAGLQLSHFSFTVQQSSFYGYTSMLPSRYTQAVMTGESECPPLAFP